MKRWAKVYIVIAIVVIAFFFLLFSGGLKILTDDIISVKDKATNIVDQGIQMSDSNLNDRMDQMTRREHCTDSLEISFLNTGDYPCAVVWDSGQLLVYGYPNNAHMDELKNELEERNNQSISVWVIPRATDDAVAAIQEIADMVLVRQIILPSSGYKDEEFDNFLEKITSVKNNITDVRTAESGDDVLFGNAIYSVLSGSGSEMTEDSSLLLQIWNASESYLLAGWATSDEMDAFVKNESISESVVYMPNIVTTSGETDISGWIKTLGKNASYVFPCDLAENGSGLHDNVYRILRKKEIQYYRTDLQGTIKCVGNSNKVTFKNEPAMRYHFGD